MDPPPPLLLGLPRLGDTIAIASATVGIAPATLAMTIATV
jgi:hypothetical protein